MSETELILRCVYCGYDTHLIVKTTKAGTLSGRTIRIVRYCEHCQRPNGMDVPENVDVHPFVLGKDHGFVAYQEGIPVIQGERDL